MSRRAAERTKEAGYARQEALLRTVERLEQRDTQQAAAADLVRLVRDLDGPALSTLLHVLAVQTAKTLQFARMVGAGQFWGAGRRSGMNLMQQRCLACQDPPSSAPASLQTPDPHRIAAGVPARNGAAHHTALPAAGVRHGRAHPQQAAGPAACAARRRRQQVGSPASAATLHQGLWVLQRLLYQNLTEQRRWR